MRAFLPIVILITGYLPCLSQNLVLNPGAEGTPASTGWTILSTGGATCVVGSAASTYSGWTMTPDGSTNYPAAHGGSKTFFSGCTVTVPGGPFELFQDINVSVDAVYIDAGAISYVFSGYIQTPVSPQADAGRFIVDFMNAAGTIIGASYSSAPQSYANCTCSTWNLYTNTRLAPAGTRKVRVRIQATVATGPAINAYFDDISLLRSSTLPVVLISFSGSKENNGFRMHWVIGASENFSRFEIEKSTDAVGFLPVANVKYVKEQADYDFTDPLPAGVDRIFYRLKMIDNDGKFVYSSTIEMNRSGLQVLTIFPNPANKNVTVTGLLSKGTIAIRAMNGNKMMETKIISDVLTIDVSIFPHGLYILSYSTDKSMKSEQFLVQ